MQAAACRTPRPAQHDNLYSGAVQMPERTGLEAYEPMTGQGCKACGRRQQRADAACSGRAKSWGLQRSVFSLAIAAP